MKNRIIKEVLSITESFAIAAVIAYLLIHFVMIPVVVDGSSMEPNLYNGDRGMSFLVTRKMGINRFDTVVIDSDQNDYLIVKRVVGLPGETVSYVNSKLYINGVYVAEDFEHDPKTSNFAMVLGEGEYCCLGDNRSNSRDSRSYGAFKESEIVSSHLLILYPLSQLGVKS